MMKKLVSILTFITIISSITYSQRIKDIAYFSNESSEQIIGYGLVTGLAGTGDTQRSSFTVQSITSMLKRFGITVPQDNLRTRNVAAVMVTATLDGYLKPGARFDVDVSSLGDARSLTGGTLLMTPLSGMNGIMYGYAQGAISVGGGYNINTPSGNRVARNHSLAGRVPQGGLLRMPVKVDSLSNNIVNVFLRNPDFTTSNNVAKAINAAFGENTAFAKDESEIQIKVPADKKDNLIPFLAEVESLQVETDDIAKVVLNERTGTVVAGSNVKIKPVTISHGNLNIQIDSYPIISQPGAFSNGTTTVFNNLVPTVSQDSTSAIAIKGASTVQEVAAALNSLKVSPRDIIAIFQALKEAGALVGELEVL